MTVIDTARFRFCLTSIPDVWEVDRKPIHDSRGYFSRFFCHDEFSAVSMDTPPTQINFSRTNIAGTVRGVHFQYSPQAETKIVTCLRGKIFDVAVDLRRDSPTFLQWFGTTLSESKQNSLIIPPGVAHGFQSLVDDAEVMYLVSATYDSSLEDGLHPFDPAIGIEWPLPHTEVSERDLLRSHIDPSAYAGLTTTGGRR